MLRLLAVFTLMVSLLFSLLTIISAVIGGAFDPYVAIALVAPAPQAALGTGTSLVDINEIALIDTSRFLRALRRLPVNDVQEVRFDSYHHVIVSTYFSNPPQKQYKAGLYRYNYLTDQLTVIDTFESDLPSFSANGVYYDYFPIRSSDDRLAYLAPTDEKIHIHDLKTGEVRVLEALQLEDGIPRNLSWSPDNTQLLLAQYQTLFIIDSDGGNLRRIRFDTNQFYPYWSEDGQYIWLQRFFERRVNEPPVQLIHAADGTEVEAVQGLEGPLIQLWDCENQWFGYRETANESIEALNEGYLLNIKSGERIRLNDYPPLDEVKIESIMALHNSGCEKFLISVTDIQQSALTPPGPSNAFTRSYYLFDRTNLSTEVIAEQVASVYFGEHEIYFEKQASPNHNFQLFRHPIDPPAEPVLIGEYPPVQADWRWWDEDMRFALYLEWTHANFFGGMLTLFDLPTQQTYRLTWNDEYVESFVMFKWSEMRAQG